MADFDPTETALSSDVDAGGPGATVDAPAPADLGSAGSAPTTPSHRADDLGDLLNEFEKSAGGVGKDTPAAPEQRPAIDWANARGFSDSEILALAMQSDSQRLVLDSLLEQQIAQARRNEQQARQQTETAHFAEIVDEAAAFIEDLPLADPKDFAKRWFLAEVQLDPVLREAWEQHLDSPEAHKRAIALVNRKIKQLRASAKSMPDPEATADRAMVTAAVRGASGKEPPSRPPNYAGMTTQEFAEAKDRAMGQ